MTAPATASGISRATIVMIGMRPFRNAWRMMTSRYDRPFDLAVVTYSLLSTSSMLARV